MTRLIHLTDLHFGLHRTELVAPMRDAIIACRPDVVVASGDLTQRARADQFQQAMAFLDGLGPRLLVIPGNHDIPLYNLAARFLWPFDRYSQAAGNDLSPALTVGHLRIFGVNTADPFSWRGGVARADQIDQIASALRHDAVGGVNILVGHHPFEEPPGFERGETAGAKAATDRLAAAGLHAVLTGHLHNWTTGLGITPTNPRRLFHMQTGTALCSRVGEKDHGFAVMDFDADRLSVTPWIVNESVGVPEPRDTRDFRFADGHWHL